MKKQYERKNKLKKIVFTILDVPCKRFFTATLLLLNYNTCCEYNALACFILDECLVPFLI